MLSKKWALRLLRLFSIRFLILKVYFHFKNRNLISSFKSRVLQSAYYSKKSEARKFYRKIRYRIISTFIIDKNYPEVPILVEEGFLQILLMFAEDLNDLKKFSFPIDGIIFTKVSASESINRQLNRAIIQRRNQNFPETMDFINIMAKRLKRANEIIDFYQNIGIKVFTIDTEDTLLDWNLIDQISNFSLNLHRLNPN